MHTPVGFQALDESAIHELETTFFKILLARKKFQNTHTLSSN